VALQNTFSIKTTGLTSLSGRHKSGLENPSIDAFLNWNDFAKD